MIIVLEGADCVGKSTLAEAITERLMTEDNIVCQFNHGPLKGDALTEYLVPLQQHNGSDVWIFDRLHLGELVYGPVMRGGSKLTLPQAHYIELVLRTLGTINVHVNASKIVLHQRFLERGDDYVDWEQLEQVWAMYNTLRSCEFTHYASIYTDTWPMASNVRDILQGLKVMSQRQDNDLPNDYIGSYRPRVLLLGDSQGTKQEDRPVVRWPFVPWKNTSGHWLFEALLAAGIRPRDDIGLANACERTPEALSDLWKTLDTPPVVALGVNARNACVEAGLPVVQHISHPQHARRFHHNDKAEYGQQIKKVMK